MDKKKMSGSQEPDLRALPRWVPLRVAFAYVLGRVEATMGIPPEKRRGTDRIWHEVCDYHFGISEKKLVGLIAPHPDTGLFDGSTGERVKPTPQPDALQGRLIAGDETPADDHVEPSPQPDSLDDDARFAVVEAHFALMRMLQSGDVAATAVRRPLTNAWGDDPAGGRSGREREEDVPASWWRFPGRHTDADDNVWCAAPIPDYVDSAVNKRAIAMDPDDQDEVWDDIRVDARQLVENITAIERAGSIAARQKKPGRPVGNGESIRVKFHIGTDRRVTIGCDTNDVTFTLTKGFAAYFIVLSESEGRIHYDLLDQAAEVLHRNPGYPIVDTKRLKTQSKINSDSLRQDVQKAMSYSRDKIRGRAEEAGREFMERVADELSFSKKGAQLSGKNTLAPGFSTDPGCICVYTRSQDITWDLRPRRQQPTVANTPDDKGSPSNTSEQD
ncbi:MAG: hypothetical protein WCJ64_03370 [Rhodospirillaceae bacterium]